MVIALLLLMLFRIFPISALQYMPKQTFGLSPVVTPKNGISKDEMLEQIKNNVSST
ncbi:MAG: hypothetical protein U0Z17_04460 [Bacteroidales bacterium]